MFTTHDTVGKVPHRVSDVSYIYIYVYMSYVYIQLLCYVYYTPLLKLIAVYESCHPFHTRPELNLFVSIYLFDQQVNDRE